MEIGSKNIQPKNNHDSTAGSGQNRSSEKNESEEKPCPERVLLEEADHARVNMKYETFRNVPVTFEGWSCGLDHNVFPPMELESCVHNQITTK